MIVIGDGHRRCSTDVTSWPISHQGKKVNLYLMYYFPFDIPGRRKSSNPVHSSKKKVLSEKKRIASVVCVWMEATNATAGKPSHVCGSSSSVIVSILQKCLWREERSYKKTSSTLTLENKTEGKFLHPLQYLTNFETLALFALHLRLFHLGSKLVFWRENGL